MWTKEDGNVLNVCGLKECHPLKECDGKLPLGNVKLDFVCYLGDLGYHLGEDLDTRIARNEWLRNTED